MSNYKVVYNGLWQINILSVDINALEKIGTDPKAFEKAWYQHARQLGIQPIQPNEGIFSQMVSFADYQEARSLSVEDITEAIEHVFDNPNRASERRFTMHTGPRGHDLFQRAMEDELRRQVERSPMPPVIISTGGRTHNQRVQLEQSRLQSGEIDLLTYLDNISRDDI